MTGSTELEEVGALVEVAINRSPQFDGGHVLELSSRAWRNRVVHLLLEQGEIALRRERNRDRVRPAPSDDVARREYARAGRFAARDAVARLRERHEHPVAVAHRRDPVAKIDLRG